LLVPTEEMHIDPRDITRNVMIREKAHLEKTSRYCRSHHSLRSPPWLPCTNTCGRGKSGVYVLPAYVGPVGALLREAQAAHFGWVKDIAQVDYPRTAHRLLWPARIETAELVPSAGNDQHVGVLTSS